MPDFTDLLFEVGFSTFAVIPEHVLTVQLFVNASNLIVGRDDVIKNSDHITQGGSHDAIKRADVHTALNEITQGIVQGKGRELR